MTELSDLPAVMKSDPKRLPPARLENLEVAAARALTIERTVAVAAGELQKEYQILEKKQ
jgi:hypothetical protein